MAKVIEGITVEIGVEPSETFCAIAKVLGFVKELTCKPDEHGRCKCGTLVRWKDNCEPYETSDGLIAYKSIHPPITRHYDYCPNCGAKVVE